MVCVGAGSVFAGSEGKEEAEGDTALTGGAGGVLNTLVGALIMSIIKNGMTVVGIDIYAQQTFLGILIILAVAVTFDRSKVIIVK